jgi:hypothetical protein
MGESLGDVPLITGAIFLESSLRIIFGQLVEQHFRILYTKLRCNAALNAIFSSISLKCVKITVPKILQLCEQFMV